MRRAGAGLVGGHRVVLVARLNSGSAPSFASALSSTLSKAALASVLSATSRVTILVVRAVDVTPVE
jgi:hypothetical protein